MKTRFTVMMAIGRLFAAYLIFVGSAAFAQTASLPAMAFLTAPLVSPSAAITFYGTGTTHSSSFNGISGFGGQPPEIVETARALKNDPDLIYEFVHNQIEVEYAFGLRKGPLGALIEKSGTPFDQNVLFVDLVRQAGYQAQYVIGQVTIAAADFTNWTGISDIQAACRLLAAGGIPATFNGASSWSSDCSQTGIFTSVTILHIWSQVNIGGTWYAYDPSFKAYTNTPGQDLIAASGIVPGQASTQAASTVDSGSQSGLNYIHNASEANLNAYLTTHGTRLLSNLISNAPDLDTDALVGIAKIVPTYEPSGGWRNMAPPGYTASVGTTITGDIPDQYRSTLHVNVAQLLGAAGPTSTLLDHFFYVDDIDSRRLGVISSFLSGQYNNLGTTNLPAPITLSLTLDDVPIATASSVPLAAYGVVTLTATHPYAANSGTYGSQTASFSISALAAPFAIVSGWGNISPALAAKWRREATLDHTFPDNGSPPYPCNGSNSEEFCWSSSPQSAGDVTDQQLSVNWLSQLSRMLAIQAQLGNTKADHQHSIGVVSGQGSIQQFSYPEPPNPAFENYFGITDQFTSLNIDTAISVTSTENDASRRNAVARSIALSAATLEGSVVQQTQDLPDTSSTASRFAWGNQPDNEDPCFSTTTPRPFFDFTGSTSASRSGIYKFDGSQTGCNAFAIPPNAASTWTNILESSINSYITAGFNVIASAETFLGPGARFGRILPEWYSPVDESGEVIDESTNDYSLQRGGAIVATQYDSSGNVLQIAHVLTGINGVMKGGGGMPPSRFVEYDPSKAADVLKDRFIDHSAMLGVDLKTGEASYTTPTLLSVGGKSVPYGLQFSKTFKAAAPDCFSPCVGPIGGGWTHNWDIRFNNSGSGLEAMGATSPRAAAGTLVAFLVMQDIFYESDRSNLEKDVYATLVADWWRQQMVANVATVTRGFNGQQYVRLVDNTWLPPVGAPATLTQTGSRVKTRDYCSPSGNLPASSTADYHSSARRWDFSGVTFSLRNASGDVMNFAPWTFNYDITNTCALVYGYKPTTWTFPQGPSLSFTYDPVLGVTGVTTSLGRSMTLSGFRGGETATSGGYSAGYTSTPPTGGISDAAGNIFKFDYTSVVARSATQRPVPYQQLLHVYEPVNGSAPALEYTYDSRGLVKFVKDADALQLNAHGPYSWFIAEGERGERDDPLGGAYTVYYDTDGNAVRNIDELGREVDSTYDGRHRVTSRIWPEKNQNLFTYDANDNVVSLTKVAKPGSGLSNIVVNATYDPLWNKLASITDGMGHETDLAYYSSGPGASLLQQVQRSAVGGVRPTYTYLYNSIGLPTQEVDPTGVTTTHAYDSFGNLTVTTEASSVVNGNPALNLTTTFTTDSVGNVTEIDGPRTDVADVSDFTFDADRRVVFSIGPGTSDNGTAHPRIATKYTYDADGQVIQTDRGTTTSVTGSDFASLLTVTTAYDPAGNKLSETTPTSLTQFSYDADDRLLCTAVRMNPVAYASLPASACTLGAQGSFGPDRISEIIYDAAGQTRQLVHGLGTTVQQVYATYKYSPNGKEIAVADADAVSTIGVANADALNANAVAAHQTNFVYDGFDRPIETLYGDGSGDQIASYDNDNNPLTRVTRAGQTITSTYDALDRLASKTIPAVSGLSAANTVSYAYDLAGRITSLTDTLGNSIGDSYDALGRRTGETQTMAGLSAKAVSYQYDQAGNRSRVTWPDGYYVTYGYDAANRLTAANENGATPLAAYAYDNLGRRALVQYGAAGAKVSYSWSAEGDLLTLSHDLAGAANDVGFTNSYTPAHQIVASSLSNMAYQYSSVIDGTASYAANGLNQYANVTPVGGSAVNIGYDLNGNLTSDGTFAYGYDPQNRLMTVTKTGTSIAHAYDPLGRRTAKTVNGTATYFLHAGNAEIAEYDGAGNLLRRYVPGPGIDQPIAMITAAGAITYFHRDKSGSVVAMSDASGNLTEGPYTYDSYGNCITGGVACASGEPFKYTGQRQDPETGLYYYRARYYSPLLGRFLQTDPIGYTDDINWYAYVGNDPVNGVDPTGMYDCGGNTSDCNAVNQFVQTINKSLAGLNPYSDAYSKVSAVASYLGKAGDRNGVTITPTSLKGNVLASAGEHGSINVDVGKISSFSAKYGAANPGMSGSQLRNANGAGALGHEARHERDFTRLWNGNGPSNKAQEYRTEENAYKTESGIWQGLDFRTGLWHPGMTPQEEDKAVSGAAQQSTDWWCSHGGSCQ